jgi:hypothetical protein
LYNTKLIDEQNNRTEPWVLSLVLCTNSISGQEAFFRCNFSLDSSHLQSYNLQIHQKEVVVISAVTVQKDVSGEMLQVLMKWKV